MTTTASISSQSIGTSTNIGDQKFPQKVTIAATTTSFNLAARITNGASAYDPAVAPVLYWTTSPFSVTTAVAAASFRALGSIQLRPSPLGSGVASYTTPNVPAGGAYVYFWLNIPNLPAAATLDVTCVELP